MTVLLPTSVVRAYPCTAFCSEPRAFVLWTFSACRLASLACCATEDGSLRTLAIFVSSAASFFSSTAMAALSAFTVFRSDSFRRLDRTP